MIISCPACSTGYLLPEHLVGPAGARVRCPRCQHLFTVDARGGAREPGGAVAARADEAAAEPDADPALAGARAALERLAARDGEAIERARAEGRLFAEFGPALMEAFDQFRREAGPEAAPAAFRQALREKWGVELATVGAEKA